MIGFAILILAAVVFGAMALARPAPKGHPDYDEYLEIEELRARVEALSCDELVRQRDEAFAERDNAVRKMKVMGKLLASANTRLERRERIYTDEYLHGVKLARMLDEAKRLLRRYLKETPIGNQPHMIVHEVEKFLDIP